MNKEQSERIAELEEEIRQLKQKHLEELQEISVSYTEAINKANQLEKECHALTLQLNAERERNELRWKRKYTSTGNTGWQYVMIIIFILVLVAFVKHLLDFR